MEVLLLIMTGPTNREIAIRLFLSQRTVEKHVEHLLTKTNCSKRTDLAAIDIGNGPMSTPARSD
jgi:DNA-binding NarL/FixJ family response regulator